jgi:hypothetical protein
MPHHVRKARSEDLVRRSGLAAERVADPGTRPWLTAMLDYYDRHGLPVGTRVLAALLGRSQSAVLLGP